MQAGKGGLHDAHALNPTFQLGLKQHGETLTGKEKRDVLCLDIRVEEFNIIVYHCQNPHFARIYLS